MCASSRATATSGTGFIRLERETSYGEFRVREQSPTPLLSEKGARHENAIAEEFRADGRVLVDLADLDVDATIEELRRGSHGARVCCFKPASRERSVPSRHPVLRIS
jgi:hypothetical protein